MQEQNASASQIFLFDKYAISNFQLSVLLLTVICYDIGIPHRKEEPILNRKIFCVLLGANALLLASLMIGIVGASQKTADATLIFRDIRLVVDGNAVEPTNAVGAPVEPFIIDGTTYLPVRAVANALGKEVSWDDATSTVYIGIQPEPETPDEAPDETTDETTDVTPDEDYDHSSDLAYIRHKGTLVIGVTDYPPFDYRNDDGAWTGFDAALAADFAAQLGVTPVFTEIDWDDKVGALENKTIDVVWNAMTRTENVVETMTCSDIYASNCQRLIVRTEDIGTYTSVSSLKDQKVAVENGTAGAYAAKNYKLTTVGCADPASALAMVADGTAAAAVTDTLYVDYLVGEGKRFPALTDTGISLYKEPFVVGSRKDSDIVTELNNFFATGREAGYLDGVAARFGLHAILDT